jgi:ribosomal protein L7/L12
VSASTSDVGRISLQLDELERKVQFLFDHLGVHYAPPEEPYLTQARTLLADGRETDAIKVVREATGLGLVEAKIIVDNLAR